MFKKGTTVLDRRSRDIAEVVRVRRVPPCTDLFGAQQRGHLRFILRFPDGRFANDRRIGDLEAVQ